MNLIQNDICHCKCHEPGVQIMHFMPCCEGKCNICNEYIKHMDAHLRDTHGIGIKK
jgi:hypothetical protein